MTKKRTRPPEPAKQLFENLFVRRGRDETLTQLSEGLIAVAANADRLVKDALILLEAERYASAAFLLATADEEMAKSYILLDACRVDFSRHQNVLRRLCKAFYSHIAKDAYNKVARSSHFHNMPHVKDLWDLGITRWWPADSYDATVPDMPHQTYFKRQMPLYVDFIDQDQAWFTPQVDTSKSKFDQTIMIGGGALLESQAALERLRETSDAGLYSPEGLSILNEAFKKHYIKEDTSTKQISRLYEQVAQRIENELGIASERFYRSALHEWPLYHFVSQGF